MDNISMRSQTVTDAMGNVLIRVTLQDGIEEIEKTLSVEQYVDMLKQGAIKLEDDQTRVGRLPNGFYDAMIGKKKSRIVLTFTGQKRAFCLCGVPMIIPFPALCFVFDMDMMKGTLQRRECFALDTDNPDDNSRLFCYPFGNVNEYGNICFGNIDVNSSNTSLDKLNSVVENFFSGVTNNDYYGDCELNLSGLDQGALTSKLKKRAKFPTEWLKPTMSDKHYIGDFFK